MDEQNVEHRKPAGQYTWLWMILALALVGGFLVWLGVESEPTQIQVVEEDAVEEDTTTAADVSLDAFAANTDQYAGEDVRLTDIPVASLLGPRMFWTELPGEQAGLTVPYLIALDTAAVADSLGPETGENVTVVGQVFEVTDSVLDGWVQSGVLQEAQRLEAEFASSYLQVRQLRPVQEESDSEDNGGSESTATSESEQ